MIIAVIPARGGSKGIPHKNISLLLDKPLLAYTIQAARTASSIDRTFVSTDDPKIAAVAMALGAEVIDRPASLGQDNSPTLPVLIHALDQLGINNLPEQVVTLQPTSPLRTSAHIDQAIARLTPDYDSCVSVCLAEHSPYKMLRLEGGSLRPFVAGTPYGIPRQQLPAVYRENGAIYVTWTHVLLEKQSIWGDHANSYVMDAEASIDIDTRLDLRLAELIIKERAGREV